MGQIEPLDIDPLDLGPIRERLDTYGERSIQTVPDYEYELIATRGDVRDLLAEVDRLRAPDGLQDELLAALELWAACKEYVKRLKARIAELESQAKLRAGG